MPGFLKDHPIAAPVAALGGLIAVSSLINDAYSLVTAGLPNQVWQAVGLLVFFVSTASIVFRQHRVIQRTIPGGSIGGGPDSANAALTGSDVPWKDAARLTLVFENDLTYASPACQEGVNWYYWTSVPAFHVNWETEQLTSSHHYVIVFLAFDYPMHTNNSRVCAVGGGIHCEVLGHHPSGATVRAIGDLAGRTLDIRFSKTPIPI